MRSARVRVGSGAHTHATLAWIERVSPAGHDNRLTSAARAAALCAQWFWNVSTPGSADYQNFATYDQIMVRAGLRCDRAHCCCPADHFGASLVSTGALQDLIAPPASHALTVKRWLVQNGVRFQSIVDRRDSLLVTACA
jgi:hypothetical protein